MKHAYSFLIAGTLALLMSGCGTKPSGPQTSALPTAAAEAQLIVYCPEEQLPSIRSACEQFAAESEDPCTVHVLAESLDTVVMTVLTDPANAADVFVCRDEDHMQLIEGGFLLETENGSYGYELSENEWAAVNAAGSSPEAAVRLARTIAEKQAE